MASVLVTLWLGDHQALLRGYLEQNMILDRAYTDNAELIRVLEYLTSERAQSVFADGNNEYPAVPSVGASSKVAALGEFKEDGLSATELGVHQSTAIMVFDRAGWQ